MKAIQDCIIGNTAVRIIDTGRRIRVIDVEKQKTLRQFKKTVAAMILAAVFSFSSTLLVIDKQSDETILSKQVYSLKTEIDTLERENKILEKKITDDNLTYKEIYKKATAMGMSFPDSRRIATYKYKKGSGIRIYQMP